MTQCRWYTKEGARCCHGGAVSLYISMDLRALKCIAFEIWGYLDCSWDMRLALDLQSLLQRQHALLVGERSLNSASPNDAGEGSCWQYARINWALCSSDFLPAQNSGWICLSVSPIPGLTIFVTHLTRQNATWLIGGLVPALSSYGTGGFRKHLVTFWDSKLSDFIFNWAQKKHLQK